VDGWHTSKAPGQVELVARTPWSD